ncbi:hypothetical protein NQ315_000027 [Exocentrus adspersus]|uniref:BED-type domain-containing protein n=1 Tax=Exocentrus adspersus TaxID=1586481 RepID=A0AAV8VGH8_9CUCU|nr:hypothetical protein NQ315_000027 [Exocentrus adspersus]
MGRKERSVWKHYTKFKKPTKKGKPSYLHGKCNFCGTVYLSNALRMEKHLTSYKNAPWNIRDKYMNPSMNPSANSRRPSTGMSQSEGEDKENESSSSSTVPTNSGRTIQGFMDTMHSNEKQVLDRMFARALFSSSTPHLFVENQFVKLFMERLRPSYELPSRNKISTTLLEKEYELLQKLVREKIKSSDCMALLTDGWTDINGIALINIIFRSIDSKIENMKTILGNL